MSLLRICVVLLLADWVVAFAVHNAVSNTTSVSVSTSSRIGKIHIESSASGWDETSASETPPQETRPGGGNIGSIIKSNIGTIPTVTSEVTPTGTEDVQRPHFESSANGFNGGVTIGQTQTPASKEARPKITASNEHAIITAPRTQPTRVVIGSQTLTPGGETATVGVGDGATKIHLDESGSPIVVIGDKTSTAQISPSTAVIEGQSLTRGGSAITVGTGSQATTYSIDSDGKTIAVAQGMSSTLDTPPTQVFTIGDITATAEAQTAGALGGLDVSTLVNDGTTEYIINSQTLSPDHPITIDGTAISINTSAGSTVLVVGDMTTTIKSSKATGSSDATTTEFAAGATPGSASFSGGGAAATTSKKSGAIQTKRRNAQVWLAMVFGIAITFARAFDIS